MVKWESGFQTEKFKIVNFAKESFTPLKLLQNLSLSIILFNKLLLEVISPFNNEFSI